MEQDVKLMQLQGRWIEVERIYIDTNQKNDALSTRMIINAISKGDMYRELVSGICKDYELGKINSNQLHISMIECYDKVYNNF